MGLRNRLRGRIVKSANAPHPQPVSSLYLVDNESQKLPVVVDNQSSEGVQGRRLRKVNIVTAALEASLNADPECQEAESRENAANAALMAETLQARILRAVERGNMSRYDVLQEQLEAVNVLLDRWQRVQIVTEPSSGSSWARPSIQTPLQVTAAGELWNSCELPRSFNDGGQSSSAAVQDDNQLLGVFKDGTPTYQVEPVPLPIIMEDKSGEESFIAPWDGSGKEWFVSSSVDFTTTDPREGTVIVDDRVNKIKEFVWGKSESSPSEIFRPAIGLSAGLGENVVAEQRIKDRERARDASERRRAEELEAKESQIRDASERRWEAKESQIRDASERRWEAKESQIRDASERRRAEELETKESQIRDTSERRWEAKESQFRDASERRRAEELEADYKRRIDKMEGMIASRLRRAEQLTTEAEEARLAALEFQFSVCRAESSTLLVEAQSESEECMITRHKCIISSPTVSAIHDVMPPPQGYDPMPPPAELIYPHGAQLSRIIETVTTNHRPKPPQQNLCDPILRDGSPLSECFPGNYSGVSPINPIVSSYPRSLSEERLWESMFGVSESRTFSLLNFVEAFTRGYGVIYKDADVQVALSFAAGVAANTSTTSICLDVEISNTSPCGLDDFECSVRASRPEALEIFSINCPGPLLPGRASVLFNNVALPRALWSQMPTLEMSALSFDAVQQKISVPLPLLPASLIVPAERPETGRCLWQSLEGLSTLCSHFPAKPEFLGNRSQLIAALTLGDRFELQSPTQTDRDVVFLCGACVGLFEEDLLVMACLDFQPSPAQPHVMSVSVRSAEPSLNRGILSLMVASASTFSKLS